MTTIESLPVELETQVLELAPELRFANTHYFSLYNDMFRQRLFNEYGQQIEQIIFDCHKVIIAYVKSFESVKYHTRNAISKALSLVDISDIETIDDIYRAKYINDSWLVIYFLIKYRKIFPDEKDFVLQQSDKYDFDQKLDIMSVKRTNSLNYEKEVYLSYGLYNLSVGLMIDKVSFGLGTIKFRVEVYENDPNIPKHVYDYYSATNIDEVAPKNTFFMLNLGKFPVYSDFSFEDSEGCRKDLIESDDMINNTNGSNVASAVKLNGNIHLRKVRLIMEETGLNLKAGMKFFYFDLKPPGVWLQDQYLFWTLSEPMVRDYNEGYQELVNFVEKEASIVIGECVSKVYGSVVPSAASLSSLKKQPKCLAMSYGELKSAGQKFFISSNSNQIKRRIKFVTIISQNEFLKLTKGILYDKMGLGNDKFLLRWRTNWL